MIRALCITQDPDRPTLATFIGLQRGGIDVTVVCPDHPEAGSILRDCGVAVLDMEIGKRRDAAAIRRLRSELVEGRYDILHLFSNRAIENGLIAARGLPVRVVAYRGIVGNVSFLDPVSWMRILNPRIDRIVCVANAVRDYLLAMRPAFLRMPEERPVTIYKGHSLDWYRSDPADLGEFGIPGGAFVIVCVANYRPRKGFEYLIDAFAQLPEEWGAHLLLVGKIDNRRIEKMIARSPAADRIHRTGIRRDAPALAASSDVFVLPSVKREGLSRSLIEAMASRVAPIVTNCGGNPELVVDRECGIVVPVKSSDAIRRAIQDLHDDPSLRARFADAARERIRVHFRIEDTIAKTAQLYEELVAAT